MISFWILEFDAVRDRVGIELRLRERDARFQASQAVHAEGSAKGGWLEANVRPHLIAGSRKSEAGRHDSDDGGGYSVQIDLAAEDVRVGAESVAPPGFADDGYAGCVGCILASYESPAHHGLDAQHVEDPGCDIGALYLLGIFGARDVEQRLAEEFDGFKGVIALFQIQVVGDRHRAVLGVLRREMVEDERDPVRIGIRERTQQNAVDDAEDRGGSTNSKSERKNRDDSESRAAAQHTPAVSNILKKGLHEESRFRLANLFFELVDAAGFEIGLARRRLIG